jgi:hypothetical protein
MLVLDNEIWVDVKNFEDSYQVSNLGRVKSKGKLILKSNGRIMTFPERIISQSTHYKNNYNSVHFTKNEIKKRFLVHRLVALNFLKTDIENAEVNHIDSDKSNNKLNNLELVSRGENQSHLSKAKKTSSDYVGVCLLTNKKWTSYITHNRKRFHLGTFKTQLEAHLSRKEFELKNNINNKYS